MKRLLRYLLAGTGIIVLQTALLPHLLGIQLRPDLLLILVLYLSLTILSCSGALYAWSLGCLFDVFSGTTLGLNGIVMLIIYCLTAIFGSQFNRENPATMVVATVLGTIAQAAILVFMLLSFSKTPGNWLPVLNQLPAQLLSNLVTVFGITLSLSLLKNLNFHHKQHKAGRQSISLWR